VSVKGVANVSDIIDAVHNSGTDKKETIFTF
jgi:hypothetical protein